MLKKTLLKNTHEFLEKNFPENFFLKKKFNKKQKKLILPKAVILRKKLFQFKQKNLLLLQKKNSVIKEFFCKFQNKNQYFQNKKHTDFLFSMHMLKSEFEKKQNKNSGFKNKLKEKKKLSILYGNLSTKQIKKTLQQANKLKGNIEDNVLILLESRLDMILYRALFFSSIKSARQYIKYNRILVNSQPVNIYSYKVKFGDIISIKTKYKKFVGKNILKHIWKYDLYSKINTKKPVFLKVNKKNFNLNFEKKFLFNLLVSNQMKVNTSTPYSLYKYMFFSNKTKLKKNQKYLNLSCATNLIFVSLKSHDKIFTFKGKKKITRNENINKNFFFTKQLYTISNFDFALIQNQIKPTNKVLLKKSIYKLNEIFNINNFILRTEKYKTLNDTNSLLMKYTNSLVSSFKIPFLLNKKKVNIQFQILLSNLNRIIKKQIKQIISFKINNIFSSKIEKKCYTNDLIQLNLVNFYDILFFLKLKNLFFKKREFFNFKHLPQKIFFKPLNLEISYKTLSIIYLFPSQKILFPCSLDVELLH